MAVKIRLKRMGAKKRPFYRVVVADARSPRDGRFIELVGYYDPLRDPAVVRLDDERIRHWMSTGARPSDAVRELLERQGVLEARPRRPRADAPAVPAAATATPAAGGAGAKAPVEGTDEPPARPVEAEAVVAEEAGAEPGAEPEPAPEA